MKAYTVTLGLKRIDGTYWSISGDTALFYLVDRHRISHMTDGFWLLGVF